MFIETIIGSSAKIKVLRALLETKTAYSMEDIKKLSGMSIGVIHKAVTSMLKENIITQKKGSGKQRFYQINLENRYSGKLLEIFDEEKIERRGIPTHIWNALEALCSGLKAKVKGIKDVILFGSLARGEFRISSDIDLLVVTEDDFKEEAKARAICRSAGLKSKVSSTFVTGKEMNGHISKKSDFYESILKEGLRLV